MTEKGLLHEGICHHAKSFFLLDIHPQRSYDQTMTRSKNSGPFTKNSANTQYIDSAIGRSKTDKCALTHSSSTGVRFRPAEGVPRLVAEALRLGP